MSDKPNAKFEILVNNQPFTTSEHRLSGSQIKALAGVPADYELFEVKGDKTVTVGDSQEAQIHQKLHFRAIPAGTFGSRDASS